MLLKKSVNYLIFLLIFVYFELSEHRYLKKLLFEKLFTKQILLTFQQKKRYWHVQQRCQTETYDFAKLKLTHIK